MVKIPIGAEVIIDLWNTKKKKGMVKFYTDTQFLVRGTSDFNMVKGDEAIVMKSKDNWVEVAPKNNYTRVLKKKDITRINHKRLAELIFKILQEEEMKHGGIIPIPTLLEQFRETPIKNIINKKDILKAIKVEESPLIKIKDGNLDYIAIPIALNSRDINLILKYAKKHAFITFNMIQEDTNWLPIRIERDLDFLVKKKICKKDESYREGTRYYFLSE